MADQQADLAKVRQLAQFGHAQAEGFAAAQPRRLLQHVDGGGHRDALIGGFQQRRTEAGLSQQAMAVEAQMA
ncbi:hypothetical protein D1872_336900 [compost metagenome]